MIKEPRQMSQDDLVALGHEHLYQNYRQPPLVIKRGQGARVWDVAGKQYFDLFAGIAVSTLGHGHPRLVAAIAEQAEQLIHVSNYFFNQPNVELANASPAASFRLNRRELILCGIGILAGAAATAFGFYFAFRGR